MLYNTPLLLWITQELWIIQYPEITETDSHPCTHFSIISLSNMKGTIRDEHYNRRTSNVFISTGRLLHNIFNNHPNSANNNNLFHCWDFTFIAHTFPRMNFIGDFSLCNSFFLSRKSQLLPFARKVLGFGKMLRQHKTKAFVMVRIMPNWNKNSSRALQAHYRKINLPELYQKKNLANNHQGYKNKNHSYHNHLQFYSYSFSYSI